MNVENGTAKDKVLVTGIAGFIGFHFARRLLREGLPIVGVDSINDYYDPELKYSRLRELGFSAAQVEAVRRGQPVIRLETNGGPDLAFHRLDLQDRERVAALFANEGPQRVVHLAAQAGVRYSFRNPHAYIDSNISGFLNILENCRLQGTRHLVYASSSSVYGANEIIPFSVHQNVDHPVSLYAATKKANELMAHAYSHLFGLPVTGLRFFTVYGPWGRPDMALFIFTRKILAGEPIDVYNHGRMKRDFTYIDDIVEGVWRVLAKVPARNERWNGKQPDPASSSAPYRLFNIGNQQPVDLLSFIEIIERRLGKKAEKNLQPLQPGDVVETCAEIGPLREWIGFEPHTPLDEGIGRFVDWYRAYYRT